MAVCVWLRVSAVGVVKTLCTIHTYGSVVLSPPINSENKGVGLRNCEYFAAVKYLMWNFQEKRLLRYARYATRDCYDITRMTTLVGRRRVLTFIQLILDYTQLDSRR